MTTKPATTNAAGATQPAGAIHQFQAGQFVTVTRGAFRGFPAQIERLNVSRIYGYPVAAYQIALCDHSGRECTATLREDWIAQ